MTPLRRQLETFLLPEMAALVSRISQEGDVAKIGAMPVFAEIEDPFLPGSLWSMACWLSTHKNDRGQFWLSAASLMRIFALVRDRRSSTWGTLFFLRGLYWLHRAGRLEKALKAVDIAELRTRLDWRTFVDPDSLALIDAPTNYYGVALGIALFRQALGWEEPQIAEILLDKVALWFERETGVAIPDETEGEGRFDRYSLLLSSEIAAHFIKAGFEPPARLHPWVQKSSEVFLLRLNAEGTGLEYGRSLGPYGDSAMVEALASAAACGLLSDDTQRAAASFTAASAQRYLTFWCRSETGGLDIWEHGRAADVYRGRHRVLTENISLASQYIHAAEVWRSFGLDEIEDQAALRAHIRKTPKISITSFDPAQPSRALVTLNLESGRFGIPFVNGAEVYFKRSDYLPIPYSVDVISGAPLYGYWPQLVPQIRLEDGTLLMPIVYMSAPEVASDGPDVIVTYRCKHLCRVNGTAPQPYEGVQGVSEYRFSGNRITRTDTFEAISPLRVESVTLEFGAYSQVKRMTGKKILYRDGRVKTFEVDGYDEVLQLFIRNKKPYRTPTGPLRSSVRFSRHEVDFSTPVTLAWHLEYLHQV